MASRTDHASIATEVKVVNQLAEQGIKKEDIGREEFLKHVWEWKEEYGGRIVNQLKSWALPATGKKSALPWTKVAATL